MLIPVAILILVFLLIAVREVGGFRFQIWQIMLGGAVAVLLAGQISPADALNSINVDVMLFLFGMFVVGQALDESGYLSHLAYKFFRKAKTIDQLILTILFGAGLASAFLMNDTLAIIGTPVILLLAKKHGISAKPLLLTLAFAVTIGSVTSPIGNPQNLLIAVNGRITNQFITFFRFLLLPTIVNLFLTYLLLKIFYGKHFHDKSLKHSQEPIRDHRLALLSKTSLILVVLLVLARIAAVFLGMETNFKLTYIALIPALLILTLSPKRLAITKRIDWQTLIFFAAMFVLMESVWNSGFFQTIIGELNLNITSAATIFAVSILLSQLISNVPLVALYLPMLIHAGSSTVGLMALAAGSTIAGNLLILGAASNVIIIQNAETRSKETITFLEFMRIGVPLTAVNAIVYWIFLMWAA